MDGERVVREKHTAKIRKQSFLVLHDSLVKGVIRSLKMIHHLHYIKL